MPTTPWGGDPFTGGIPLALINPEQCFMLGDGMIGVEGCANSTPARGLASIALSDLGVLDRPPVQCEERPEAAEVRLFKPREPRWGDRGDDVRDVQDALKKKSDAEKDPKLDPKGVDGAFFGGTKAAVQEFQKKNGLPPTGVVDEATAKALGVTLADVPRGGKTFAGAPNTQFDITGTREGLTSEEEAKLNPTTSYGFLPNEDKFVALPCQGLGGFWVTIATEDGQTATVPVGDIGPHYGKKTQDCYWETGARPKAEGGGSPNKAGIDISEQLWNQLKLPREKGMVKVSWHFTPPPADGICRLSVLGKDGKPITHTNKGGKR